MLSKSPIKAFAKVGAGQGAPQKETDFSNEGCPFIRAGHLEDLIEGKDELDLPKVNSKVASIYRLKLYQPDTIVFAKSGMSAMKGRIYKLKNPCYIVNHLATLKLNEKAFSDFVVYTLRYFSPVKLINDSSYPSLKQSTIENYEIPLPKKISNQIHIADILTKAENLISQRKVSIRLLDEYLKSTFLEMFGDPLRNEKAWNKLDGGNYCQKLTVGVVIKPASHYVEKGVIAIRSLNVKPNKFDLTNLVYFSKKTNETELSKSILREGDVVFVRTGVTGTAAIVPKELDGCNCIDLIITRPKIGVINAKYLTYFFNSDIGKRIVASKEVGGIQKHFNIGAIKALKIPVPPIELQNRFAQIVEKTESLKTQYQQSMNELEHLYGSLSQKAFRGELGFKEEDLMIAADPDVTYSQVHSRIPEKSRGFAKQVLSGKIISILRDKDHFTHIKIQKLQYLAEQYIEEDLNWNYYRQTAGPYDNKYMHTLSARLKQNNWFEEKQFKFYPLGKVAEIDRYYESYFGNKKEKLSKLFSLLINSTERLCEAVATIYAVWNNHINLKQDFNHERIKQDFFEWSNRKANLFSESDFDKALAWMLKHEIVPTGFGKLIKESKKNLLK